MSPERYDVLAECLERLEKGEDPETVLYSDPRVRNEVQPLLDIASRLRLLASRQPSSDLMLSIERLVVSLPVGETHRPSPRWFAGMIGWLRAPSSPVFVLGTRALAAVMAVLILYLGMMQASVQALPGEPLYPVKRVLEGAERAVALAPEHRADLSLRLAGRRLDEAEAVLKSGRTDALPQLLSRDYVKEVEDARSVAQQEHSPQLSARVQEGLSKHRATLENIAAQAPEKLQAPIRQAADASQMGLVLPPLPQSPRTQAPQPPGGSQSGSGQQPQTVPAPPLPGGSVKPVSPLSPEGQKVEPAAPGRPSGPSVTAPQPSEGFRGLPPVPGSSSPGAAAGQPGAAPSSGAGAAPGAPVVGSRPEEPSSRLGVPAEAPFVPLPPAGQPGQGATVRSSDASPTPTPTPTPAASPGLSAPGQQYVPLPGPGATPAPSRPSSGQ